MIIHSMTNTIFELKGVQLRLDYLTAKKEELFTRYIMPKAMQVDQVGGQNMPKYTDATMQYVIAVDEVKKEIEQLTAERNRLIVLLEDLSKTMMNLQGIEFDLFYEIAVKGSRPKKAIQRVAASHFMSESNVWNVYYPKVKNELQMLKEGRKNENEIL